MDSGYTENIIRIQRNIRGFLERKRLLGLDPQYHQMITSKKLRTLNNYGVIYDFYPELNLGSLETSGLLQGCILKSNIDLKDSEGFSQESGSNRKSSSCSQNSIEKLIKMYEDSSENCEESQESLENSQDDPVEILVFEAEKKAFVGLDEIFEDFMPPSVSFIIIVEDFIEKKVIPIRQRVVCGTFEMSVVEVTKFEVNLAKPCCEIKVIEGVMQKVENNSNKIKSKEGVKESSSLKSQEPDVTDKRVRDKAEDIKEIDQEYIENNSNLSSLSYSSSKSEIKFSPFIEKTVKKVQNSFSPLQNQHSKLSASKKSKSSDESSEKTEFKPKTPEKDPELIEQLTKTNEIPKENSRKSKQKYSIKDLLKQNAPNTQKPIKVAKKDSVISLPLDSNQSPASINLQLASQNPSKNLKIDIQIHPSEFNFLHKLGHKPEDQARPDHLDLLKPGSKPKLLKRPKDKFYPYEKWTQVLPKLKKPQIVYSTYKDYGFLSDNRPKKSLVPGRSGEHRVISSGSEQNLLRFRKKLPKFSSYKIKLAENTEDKAENALKPKDLQSAKVKKGRIHDLYTK